jgi:cytochrome c-type biogenesis protein
MTGAESFAFTAGVLAALNPCGLAMLPSFVAFFVTTEGGHGQGDDMLARLVRGIVVAAAVSLGLLTTFMAAGLAISWGISLLGRVIPLLGVLVGVALVGLSVILLLGGSVPGLRVAATARRDRGLPAMAWFGVAYALGSLSCSLPVFLIVVGASATNTASGGRAVPFLAFAAGMSAVITVATIITALFTQLAFLVRRLRRHIPTLSALLLLAAGVYVIQSDLPLAVIATGHAQPTGNTVAATTAGLTVAALAIGSGSILTTRHRPLRHE